VTLLQPRILSCIEATLRRLQPAQLVSKTHTCVAISEGRVTIQMVIRLSVTARRKKIEAKTCPRLGGAVAAARKIHSRDQADVTPRRSRGSVNDLQSRATHPTSDRGSTSSGQDILSATHQVPRRFSCMVQPLREPCASQPQAVNWPAEAAGDLILIANGGKDSWRDRWASHALPILQSRLSISCLASNCKLFRRIQRYCSHGMDGLRLDGDRCSVPLEYRCSYRLGPQLPTQWQLSMRCICWTKT
jgi:hypothetical protein